MVLRFKCTFIFYDSYFQCATCLANIYHVTVSTLSTVNKVLQLFNRLAVLEFAQKILQLALCDKSCQSASDETGRTIETRIREHKPAFKSKSLNQKLVSHAIEIDHSADLSKITAFEENCNLYRSRITNSAVSQINVAGNIPYGYSILL